MSDNFRHPCTKLYLGQRPRTFSTICQMEQAVQGKKTKQTTKEGKERKKDLRIEGEEREREIGWNSHTKKLEFSDSLCWGERILSPRLISPTQCHAHKAHIFFSSNQKEEEAFYGIEHPILPKLNKISNGFGLQYSRKRYFILDQNQLNSYKFMPSSKSEDPVKSVAIDSCIRVTDDGRATIQRKLGATSSEESAQWIRSFNEAALKVES
ncbi:hypothetical protein ACLOJK_011528 [Asimina triloba]